MRAARISLKESLNKFPRGKFWKVLFRMTNAYKAWNNVWLSETNMI